ncbi:MAG: hypothetical protein U5L08_01935 [Xanthomonadales bacterium]|nr:hypothetical protein [Xanthomonadales bacterium]
MKPSILLGTATIPDTNKQMMLYQHEVKFSITIPGRGELMNSRVNGSEKALAELTCERIKGVAKPRLLIGGRHQCQRPRPAPQELAWPADQRQLRT